MHARTAAIAPLAAAALLLTTASFVPSTGAQSTARTPAARPAPGRTVLHALDVTDRRPLLLDERTISQSLDRLGEGIAALRALSEDEALPKRLRRSVRKELRALRGELERLRRVVRSAPPGIPAPSDVVVVVPDEEPPPPAPEEEVAPAAMSPAAFAEALASLEQHGFASEKLDVIEELATHNWFLSEQARRLIETFSFGKDRLQALERLAPRIVDPQNNFRLYEAFTFESDKSQARRILAAQQP